MREREGTVFAYFIAYAERIRFSIGGKDAKTFCFLKDHSFFLRRIIDTHREVFPDHREVVYNSILTSYHAKRTRTYRLGGYSAYPRLFSGGAGALLRSLCGAI